MDNFSHQEKVIEIFKELVGDRHERLIGLVREQDPAGFYNVLKSEYPDEVARDIGFHMTDWREDAAFMIAVILYPERFSVEEKREGLNQFLVHSPNHVAAAAKLIGFPIADVFELGSLLDDEDTEAAGH